LHQCLRSGEASQDEMRPRGVWAVFHLTGLLASQVAMA